jgi:hypothetical protein
MLHLPVHLSTTSDTWYNQQYDTVAKSTTEKSGNVSQNELQSGFWYQTPWLHTSCHGDVTEHKPRYTVIAQTTLAASKTSWIVVHANEN